MNVTKIALYAGGAAALVVGLAACAKALPSNPSETDVMKEAKRLSDTDRGALDAVRLINGSGRSALDGLRILRAADKAASYPPLERAPDNFRDDVQNDMLKLGLEATADTDTVVRTLEQADANFADPYVATDYVQDHLYPKATTNTAG